MNFLAHAAVAARHDDDPFFVLGAALPDLLPLIGVRVERDLLPSRVLDGWMAHHRADAAFHEHPEFVRGVSVLRVDLRATNLSTGPRRAAAHVGWELLLDEAVMADEGAVAAFAAAVRAGRDLLEDSRWHGLVDRISNLRPGPPQSADVVAERVQRACSRRARLAFEIELVPQLASVLAVHQPNVNAVAARVLDEVSRRVIGREDGQSETMDERKPDSRDRTGGEPTTAPAGPDAESQDVTAQIGDRPPIADHGTDNVDPDAPAIGVLDPTMDDPPEPNEPA